MADHTVWIARNRKCIHNLPHESKELISKMIDVMKNAYQQCTVFKVIKNLKYKRKYVEQYPLFPHFLVTHCY